MDEFMLLDDAGSPIQDDPLALSALLSLDEYSDLSTGSMADPLFSSMSYPAYHQVHTNWRASPVQDTISTNLSSSSEITENECTILQYKSPSNHLDFVPRPIDRVSLHERMMKALSLLKETSEAGILAQFWMPIKQGVNCLLTTSDQPYLFDQNLAAYREVSRRFTFAAKETPGLYPGLPGRVYISGMPEWTPNVLYYKKLEYLRADYAAKHEVRGSLAVPVFGTNGGSCCAVLEIITTKEKSDFDHEMDSVCMALQSVSLRTVKAKERARLQNVTKNQKAAYIEILQLLEMVCQAHSLPLALTWVPLTLTNGKIVLSVHEPSCYVYTTSMHGFLRTCTETCLEEGQGQGMAGRAFRSNLPFFSPDVCDLNICEYPLVHHARKYGLRAAIAIRLRSAHTGDRDYILELFFPVDCRAAHEQQVLLNNLSGTMQRLCRSLRPVSYGEIRTGLGSAMSESDFSIDYFNVGAGPQRQSGNGIISNLEFMDKGILKQEDIGATMKLKMSSTGHLEKRRSTADKNISLNTLRQYFSGSLKDAAKSIGVCPTTLKRICRQHGISRWPSRKINKVNRSLKKIQNMINSVDGFEGTLKYDPATGSLIPAISSPENTAPSTLKANKPDPLFSFPAHNNLQCVPPFPKLEPDFSPIYGTPLENLIPTFKSQFEVSTVSEKDLVSSSSLTDSGSGSASSQPSSNRTMEPNSSLSSQGISGLVVKATYKHDTVRFKLHPNSGFLYVVGEVSRRFKLPIGVFQLKYKDDEEEWVVLACDSDLQECIEMTQNASLHHVKLQVLDVHFGEGSSCGSSPWFAGL